MLDNREYYRRRIDEENRRAMAETNPSVKHVHMSLAKMYRIRLEAEERAAQRTPSANARTNAFAGEGGPMHLQGIGERCITRAHDPAGA